MSPTRTPREVERAASASSDAAAGVAEGGTIEVVVLPVLAVYDIDAARAEFARQGVEVSEVFHDAGGVFHHRGTDGRVNPPPGGPVVRLVRVVQRPGRATAGCSWRSSRASLAGERAYGGRESCRPPAPDGEHHDPWGKTHVAHDWWDWYAPHMAASEQGSTPEAASAAAGRYMEDVRDVPA